MNVASDQELDEVVLNWVPRDALSRVEISEPSKVLTPIVSFISLVTRRNVVEIAQYTSSEEGYGWDWGGFSYNAAEDFEDDGLVWNGVMVYIPEYATGSLESSRVFISKEAWLRFVIRVGGLFLQHPDESSTPLDFELNTSIERLLSK